MVNAKKVELISELRQLRDKKGITYQQIVDATESIGYPVSLSTVKKCSMIIIRMTMITTMC